jgi:hypothetical protein
MEEYKKDPVTEIPEEEGLEFENVTTTDPIYEPGVGGYNKEPKRMVKGQKPLQVKKQYFGEY